MLNKADEIISAVEMVAEITKAEKLFIALKETYTDEIASLQDVIDKKNSSIAKLN